MQRIRDRFDFVLEAWRPGDPPVAAILARKSTEQVGVTDEQRSVTRQVEHARAIAAALSGISVKVGSVAVARSTKSWMASTCFNPFTSSIPLNASSRGSGSASDG